MKTLNWSSIDDLMTAMLRPTTVEYTHRYQLPEAPSGFPLTNVSFDDSSLLIEMALSGYRPEDIDVTLTRNILTVKGRSPEAGSQRHMVFHQIKRADFERHIALSRTYLDLESIKVGHQNGILRITIPLTQAAAPRQLQIEHQ